MLTIPTAPFAEHRVIAYIESFVGRCKDCALTRDEAGNVLVHFHRPGRAVARPVCITAHTDHPGFVSDAMSGRKRLRAMWRGWVPPELFVGTKVRFFVEDHWVRGHVKSIKTAVKAGRKRVDTAMIEVESPVPPRCVGMWDIPDPVEKNDRVHCRGCDDVAGCAAILAAIERLSRGTSEGEAYFLFTRAEEVGFVGAMAACQLGTIPRHCVLVNVETSSELPNAPQGAGPILRVGDKGNIFNPSVVAWLQTVATQLGKRDRKFQFQRKLMDGGTCEASAFCHFGYDAAGVCVALGNYHNVDRKRNRIAPEYIHLADWANMVKWFVALVETDQAYDGGNLELAKWLADLESTYAELLCASVQQPA